MSAATTKPKLRLSVNESAAVPPGYKRTDVGVIPEEWEVCRLDSLGARSIPPIKAGPFGSSLTKDTYVPSGYKVYGQEQVIRGDYRYGDYFIPQKRYRELESCAVRPGDVLLSLVGTVGKLLAIPDDAPPGVINPRLIRFSLDKNRVYPAFFQFLFESRQVQALLERKAQGGTMGVLNAGVLRPLCIQLPPMPEQRAIAEALSDVDGLLGALEALIAKKRAIKQGGMQQLLTGKTRLPGFSGEWETVAPDHVATRITGFWGASSSSDRTPHPVKVIRAGDISPLGALTGLAERYFSEAELAKAGCQIGDVVITVSGNGLGKTWLVDGQPDLAASNFVRILRSKAGRVHGPFLASALNSEDAQRLLAEHTATSAYPNLRPSFFSARWLQLPPFDEQSAIATLLSDMDAEIAALERRRDKTRGIKQGMMQQLLTGRVRLVKPSHEEAGA